MFETTDSGQKIPLSGICWATGDAWNKDLLANQKVCERGNSFGILASPPKNNSLRAVRTVLMKFVSLMSEIWNAVTSKDTL